MDATTVAYPLRRTMEMDMGTDGGMIPWLHFTPGDYLLFQAWRPTSAGATVGACIGLVLLAIFDRWVSAIRSLLDRRWRHRALASTMQSVEQSPSGDEKSLDVTTTPPRTIPPFKLAYDLPRGLIHAAQALLAYVLMLCVMTFNVAFLISIVVGLGIGEMLFGRMQE